MADFLEIALLTSRQVPVDGVDRDKCLYAHCQLSSNTPEMPSTTQGSRRSTQTDRQISARPPVSAENRLAGATADTRHHTNELDVR